MGFTPDNGSLIGTEGVDVLLQVNNNPAGNFIAALGDNDIISLQQTVSPGVLADYTVYGGAGNDTISALTSPVNTLIQGEAGNDIININTVGTVGGAIIDSSIRGGAGNDIITLVATGAGATGMVSQGGSGVDAIYASGIFGTSSIRGGADDDTIRFVTDSTLVSSQLNGGQGDDLITNNSGTLFGSARRVVEAIVSTISGNAGSDEIDFFLNGTSDLLIYGDSATGESTDTAVGVDGDDDIQSDAGDDTIIAGGGNDIVSSLSGSDSIAGGSGNDFIDSGTEDDNVTGDSGDDTIFGGLGDDTIDGGSGSDSIQGEDDDDLIYGRSGDDTIRGGFGGDTIDGGSGDDTLFGDEGDDEIFGDVGNDEINGGDGNDTIIGSFGDDDLAGGIGNDIITNGDGRDEIFQTQASLSAGVSSSVTGASVDYNGTQFSTGLLGGVDVITDMGLDDTLYTAFGIGVGVVNGNVLSQAAADVASVTQVVYFTGTWNASAGTFSVATGGSDVLLNTAANTLTTFFGTSEESITVLQGAASIITNPTVIA